MSIDPNFDGEQTGVALLGTLTILRETHAPTLKRKLYGQDKSTISAAESGKASSLASELQSALSRPLKLVTKSPVVFSCCILIFLVIGILNVFLTLMSRDFQRVYGLTSGQSGTVYIGLALGFVLASVLFGLSNDRIMQRLTKKYKGETQPEFRLPAAIAAMPAVVVGLLWYGWALHLKAFWIVPIIGSGIAGLGITTVQVSVISSYVPIQSICTVLEKSADYLRLAFGYDLPSRLI